LTILKKVNFFEFCDAPRPWGIYFQDSASPQMEGLVELHNNVMFYLLIILFVVTWILLSIIKTYFNTKSPVTYKYLNHGKDVPIHKCFKFNTFSKKGIVLLPFYTSLHYLINNCINLSFIYISLTLFCFFLFSGKIVLHFFVFSFFILARSLFYLTIINYISIFTIFILMLIIMLKFHFSKNIYNIYIWLLIFILILSLALTGYIFGDLLFNINSYGLLRSILFAAKQEKMYQLRN
jgi:hypothetical protein